MKTQRRLDCGRLRGWAGAWVIVLALVLIPSLMAGAGALDPASGRAAPTDYRSFFGGNSRLVVWIVAQVHLMFGAFVLGVPVFASIVEIVGWRSGDPRYDRLAHEFTGLLSAAFSSRGSRSWRASERASSTT